jgi:hypothetical protein
MVVETLLDESGESLARMGMLDLAVGGSMKARSDCTRAHSVKMASLVRQ